MNVTDVAVRSTSAGRSLSDPESFSGLRQVVRLSVLFVGCVILFVTAISAQTGAGDERFLREASITVERTPIVKAGTLVDTSHLVPVTLSKDQLQALRHVLLSALLRNLKDAHEAEAHGEIPAGVPGCASYEYRLTFTRKDSVELGWLHLGSGWLAGGPQIGNIVFSEQERQALEKLLGKPRPC